MLHLPQGLRTR